MAFDSRACSFAELYEKMSYTFRLPSRKSNFCNVAYLGEVYSGRAYAPKRREVVEKFCARTPTKQFLEEQINKILFLKGTRLGNTKRALPDK